MRKIWVGAVVAALVLGGIVAVLLMLTWDRPSRHDQEQAACDAMIHAERTFMFSTMPQATSSVANLVASADETGDTALVRTAHQTRDSMAAVEGPNDTVHFLPVLTDLRAVGQECFALGITYH